MEVAQMPFSEEIFKQLTGCAKHYIDNKKQAKDSFDKLEKMRQIKTLIKETKNGSDEDWFNVLKKIGKDADTIQIEGTVHSDFTDACYRMMHIIQSQTNRTAIILEKKRLLAAQRIEYINEKKATRTSEKIAGFEKAIVDSIRELVHFGCTDPLRRLSFDEIQEIFPSVPNLGMVADAAPKFIKSAAESLFGYFGKQMGLIKNEKRFLYASDVNIPGANEYLPIVAQPEIFEQYYFKTYNAQQNIFFSKRPEPVLSNPVSEEKAPEVKPNQTEPVSRPFSELLLNDIEMYLSISGNAERMKQADDIKERLEDLTNRTEAAYKIIRKANLKDPKEAAQAREMEMAFANEWLDFIPFVGEKAHDMQVAGSINIAGVTTASCSKGTEIFHKMVHELRKEIQKNIPDHFSARVRIENNILESKLDNMDANILSSIDPESLKKIEDGIKQQRRKLAYFGDFDALLALKRTQLKDDIDMYLGQYGDEYAGALREKAIGTKVGGYKWNRTGDDDGKGCVYLPEVLWTNFPEIWRKRSTAIIKAFALSKKATNDAKTEISALTKKLALFNKQTVSSQDISEMNTSIATIRRYIDFALVKEKADLDKKLTEQVDEFNKIAASLEMKQEASRQAEFATHLDKEKAENEAAVKASGKISELNKLIEDLTTKCESLAKIPADTLHEGDTEDFFANLKSFNTIQHNLYSSIIKRLITQCNESQAVTLNQLLTETCDKLHPLQKGAQKIESILKANAIEPLLPSPRKSSDVIGIATATIFRALSNEHEKPIEEALKAAVVEPLVPSPVKTTTTKEKPVLKISTQSSNSMFVENQTAEKNPRRKIKKGSEKFQPKTPVMIVTDSEEVQEKASSLSPR